MADSGGLEKLTIIAYRNDDFSGYIGEFPVYINPEKYSRSYEICYNNVQPQGKSSGTPEYNKTKSDQIDLELVFDATGVVPPSKAGRDPNGPNGIADQIDAFLKLVLDYDSKIHSPNFLQLIWGKFQFNCRLTKLKFDYTLFKPDGTPLRAKAATTFMEYTNKVELAKEENANSPDMTHVRVVTGSDTLPLMCYEIYGTSSYYPQVAAANKLADFRNLAIGSQLVFPPVASEAKAP
ncbi:MAG: LysM peptidoglycan-binding domain-containing protein [Rhizobiales bacterium]|nr:LysM peptidoglycan-binding domain-containing protein [Hyphomicrobiales bacterium]